MKISVRQLHDPSEDGCRIGCVRQPIFLQQSTIALGQSVEKVLVLVRIVERHLGVAQAEAEGPEQAGKDCRQRTMTRSRTDVAFWSSSRPFHHAPSAASTTSSSPALIFRSRSLSRPSEKGASAIGLLSSCF